MKNKKRLACGCETRCAGHSVIGLPGDPFIEEADSIVSMQEENYPDMAWKASEREDLVKKCAGILEDAWHDAEDEITDAIEKRGA